MVSTTFRHPFTVVAAGVIGAAVPLAAAVPVGQIHWSIQRDGSSADASRVQLTIESRWSASSRSTWSTDRPISDLQGLGPAQVTGSRGPVRFALVRAAGRLDCGGVAGRFVGRGACNFTADPGFAAYLQSAGIGRPGVQDSYSLTMSGVGRSLVEALDTVGYVKPDVDQLVAMGIHGVSEDYVRGLAQSGYRLKSADDLVAFRIHGVSLDYIRELAAIGPAFRTLTSDNLVAFRIHGAKPELVRAYAQQTRGQLDADDVVAMAIHGVSAPYIEEMRVLGYRDLTAGQLVQMRIHGVSPDYVRSLKRGGVAEISPEQLVRLRIAGYRPR